MATTTEPTTKNGKNGHTAPPTTLDRRQILAGLRAFSRGEFETRLPDVFDGIDGQICETFNDIAQVAENLRSEVAELRNAVGREGRTHRRLGKQKSRGGWGDYVNSVNEVLD